MLLRLAKAFTVVLFLAAMEERVSPETILYVLEVAEAGVDTEDDVFAIWLTKFCITGSVIGVDVEEFVGVVEFVELVEFVGVVEFVEFVGFVEFVEPGEVLRLLEIFAAAVLAELALAGVMFVPVLDGWTFNGWLVS